MFTAVPEDVQETLATVCSGERYMLWLHGLSSVCICYINTSIVMAVSVVVTTFKVSRESNTFSKKSVVSSWFSETF